MRELRKRDEKFGARSQNWDVGPSESNFTK